jgi:RNA polymerase sigma-70 factor (ECF subfamily)
MAHDSIKRTRTRTNHSTRASPNARTAPTLRQTIENVQMQIVRQIVDSLPEKQRSCIQLRDFEGKAYKDIAQILDISEEQVKVNIFRGRQTIKQRFLGMEKFGT